MSNMSELLMFTRTRMPFFGFEQARRGGVGGMAFTTDSM
jgi:hypothetical protein